MRLSPASLARLPAAVARPAYDRAAQAVGIVHLGIGAFHRAHQAWYTDAAMNAGDSDWAIAGVSLRSADVAAQMNPQDGLYTVVEKSAAGSHHRVVGAVREVLVARRDGTGVARRLAAPETRIVGLTVTEKGYCRAADGSLDLALADDGSIYPLLGAAFRARRDAGVTGLTLLSCDNLAANGGQLARLMGEWLDARDPGLLSWFEAECTCPATMIDRIVPATSPEDRAAVALALGCEDAAAVVTEPFSQWVIEDRFAAGRPAWERVGAELVGDVAPYETAKLRMLNGAHSAIAYLGLLRGHTHVHQAIADPAIRALVSRLMLDEAMPTIAATPGQDLTAYAAALLARFDNSALDHRLIQIAMDGSQKLPQRWLETLAWHGPRGHRCAALLTALAAWLRHVRGDNAAAWGEVDDPRARQMASTWRQVGESGIVEALFGETGIMASPWHPTPADRSFVTSLLSGPILPPARPQ